MTGLFIYHNNINDCKHGENHGHTLEIARNHVVMKMRKIIKNLSRSNFSVSSPRVKIPDITMRDAEYFRIQYSNTDSSALKYLRALKFYLATNSNIT